MSYCNHLCTCEKQTSSMDLSYLPNQVLTNMFIGAAGATLIVRNSQSVAQPAMFIFEVTMLSAMEGMLSQSMNAVFRRSAYMFGPICSVAFVGGLIYTSLFDICKVEVSKDSRFVLIASVAYYAFFRGTVKFVTGNELNLPFDVAISKSVEGFSVVASKSAVGLSSLFKSVVANPVKWVAEKVNWFWKRQTLTAAEKMV